MIRNFRLTNEPGGLGLSCTRDGLSIAGVPLLGDSARGFAPRPPAEIDALLGADRPNAEFPRRLRANLGVIALALNRGDLAYASMVAVLTATPEYDLQSAARLVETNKRLSKYNEDQPRDWHGRWTENDSAPRLAGSAPVQPPVQVSDGETGPRQARRRRRASAGRRGP